MNKRRIGSIIILIIIIAWVIAIVVPSPQSYIGNNPLMVEKNNKPLLIAHGGGNGEFPDNTLEAFYNAYSVDKNVMMETDVSLTKDGVIILSHDTTLDRKTTLTNAPIIESNYSDLIAEEINFAYHNIVVPNSNGFNLSSEFIEYKTFDGRTVTPVDVNYPEGITPRHDTIFLATTLEELIISFPNNRINVEIKQEGEIGSRALEAVIDLMKQLDKDYNTYERIVLASFHQEVYNEMVECHEKDNRLMYSPATEGVIKFFILQLLSLDVFYNDKVAALQIPKSQSGINLATKSLVKKAHRHNIAVHYWTIDDESDMRKIIEIGADGIMTNVPSKLAKVLKEESN